MAGRLIVYVYSEAFEGLCRFYEDALGVAGARLGPSWCAFATGPSRFAVQRQERGTPRPTAPFRVDFVVDEIEPALARCTGAGARLVRGIQDEVFGRSAILCDPEGREFTLVEEELPAA